MKLLMGYTSDEIYNLWLKLYCLKANLQLGQARPLALDSNGSSIYYSGVGTHDSAKAMVEECIINNNIKGMSCQPKEIYISNITLTTVSPKGSNSYGEGSVDNSVPREYANFNRLGNIACGGTLYLNVQKRTLAITGLRKFSTCSGKNNKNVLDRLNDLHEFSFKNPNKVIDRNLYAKFITNKEIIVYAYNKLKSKPGMMTPGISPTTLDGISDNKLENLITELKNGSFKFSPARRVNIRKPNGGIRPLSLGNPIDKLVQEVIRMVLEAVYDPIFSNNSHGFRKNRSCHSALRTIFTKFRGCT